MVNMIYSQTCIKRSPWEQRQSGLIRQVTSFKRFNLYEMFYDRARQMWSFNTGDWLIEVTTWAGFYCTRIIFANLSFALPDNEWLWTANPPRYMPSSIREVISCLASSCSNVSSPSSVVISILSVLKTIWKTYRIMQTDHLKRRIN
jgi:hypothetical protein